MYRDYAINRELFHWESQSRQTPHQPSVQRYINHEAPRHARPALRARAKAFELGTQRSRSSGPCTYVDHRGERPVAFTWRLPVPMPEELFESLAALPLPEGYGWPHLQSRVLAQGEAGWPGGERIHSGGLFTGQPNVPRMPS